MNHLVNALTLVKHDPVKVREHELVIQPDLARQRRGRLAHAYAEVLGQVPVAISRPEDVSVDQHRLECESREEDDSLAASHGQDGECIQSRIPRHCRHDHQPVVAPRHDSGEEPALKKTQIGVGTAQQMP